MEKRNQANRTFMKNKAINQATFGPMSSDPGNIGKLRISNLVNDLNRSNSYNYDIKKAKLEANDFERTLRNSSIPTTSSKKVTNQIKNERSLNKVGKYVKGSFTGEALRKGALGQRGVQGAALLTVAGGLYGAKKLYDKSKNKDK